MISVDLYLLKPANISADQLALLPDALSPTERQQWQEIQDQEVQEILVISQLM